MKNHSVCAFCGNAYPLGTGTGDWYCSQGCCELAAAADEELSDI